MSSPPATHLITGEEVLSPDDPKDRALRETRAG
jgi:hypothetical protein